MLNMILYYIVFSSVILIYGTGYSVFGLKTESKKFDFKQLFIMFICVNFTSILTFLLINLLFVPFGLVEIYPFFAIFLYLIFSYWTKKLIKQDKDSSVSKNKILDLICIMLIFISISESSSLSECAIISLSSVFAFGFFVPFINTIISRILLNPEVKFFDRTAEVLFSLIVITFAILAWNVTWLNKGVFN